jgi:hypothetical protein
MMKSPRRRVGNELLGYRYRFGGGYRAEALTFERARRIETTA